MTHSVENAVECALTGGAVLTWRVAPLMLAAGVVTPLPYDCRRQQTPGKACL